MNPGHSIEIWDGYSAICPDLKTFRGLWHNVQVIGAPFGLLPHCRDPIA